jgi:creatinine amidohydrolase
MKLNEPTFLESLTWHEIAELLTHRPVGLLPVGAIEAHGPHLPLDTDVIIANATAVRTAEHLLARDVPAIILPTVSYTVSFAGTSFPGTSPVDREVFQQYMESLLAHVSRQGYRAIICCNAHLEPAHVDALKLACASVELESSVPIRCPDQRTPENAALLSDEFQAGARHAGAYETSIVMAARPDAVRTDILAGLQPVWIDLPARLRAGSRTFLEAGAEDGYFGDPATATADEGHRFLNALAGIIVKSCEEAGVIPEES